MTTKRCWRATNRADTHRGDTGTNEQQPRERAPGIKLLFVALAGVIYTTRNIDWSNVNRRSVPAPA